MFCKDIFTPIFLLFFLSLESNLKAMRNDEVDEDYKKHFVVKRLTHSKNRNSILKTVLISSKLAKLPIELIKEIYFYLQPNDFLILRGTSKILKDSVDINYLKLHPVKIKAKFSSPAIRDIQTIPVNSLSLSFKTWEQEDIEQLLSYKHVVHLCIAGLNPQNFSIGELFFPGLLSSYVSCIAATVNTFFTIFGLGLKPHPIFENVNSLDLSKSKIGDYGVLFFVSKFKKLQNLDISNNYLGLNKIGEVNALSNLSTLTSLNISSNHFSSDSVQEINKLTNLNSLDISYNFIDDDKVIKKLFLLPKLTNLINNEQRKQNNAANLFNILFYYPNI